MSLCSSQNNKKELLAQGSILDIGVGIMNTQGVLYDPAKNELIMAHFFKEVDYIYISNSMHLIAKNVA